jgi:hypothetical protein
MFFDTIEQKSKSLEKKIKDTCSEVDKLNKDILHFLADRGINPIEVSEYLGNRGNFSDKEWEELQEVKTILEERLSRDLKNIRDPRKVKEAYNDRQVRPHWIFVR